MREPTESSPRIALLPRKSIGLHVGIDQLFVMPVTTAPAAQARDTVVVKMELHILPVESCLDDPLRQGTVTIRADSPNECSPEQEQRHDHDGNGADCKEKRNSDQPVCERLRSEAVRQFDSPSVNQAVRGAPKIYGPVGSSQALTSDSPNVQIRFGL